eukprot:15470666-Alexandrium_andersonii.AAC.1
MVEDMIDRAGLRQWLEQPSPEGTPQVVWDGIKASFYEDFSEVVREARRRVAQQRREDAEQRRDDAETPA